MWHYKTKQKQKCLYSKGFWFEQYQFLFYSITFYPYEASLIALLVLDYPFYTIRINTTPYLLYMAIHPFKKRYNWKQESSRPWFLMLQFPIPIQSIDYPFILTSLQWTWLNWCIAIILSVFNWIYLYLMTFIPLIYDGVTSFLGSASNSA